MEEDIQVNDDNDIVSPSRPTPKIDLKASPRKDSFESKHKTEHKKVPEAVLDKTSSSKTHKGKVYGTDDDALHALQNGDGMRSTSSEKFKAHKTDTDMNVNKSVTEQTKGMKIEKQELTKSGITIIVTEDEDDSISKDSQCKLISTLNDGKDKDTEKIIDKSDKQRDDEVRSARVLDEIFKTTYELPKSEKTEIKAIESEETLLKTGKKNQESKTHTATLLDKIFRRFSPRSAKSEDVKSAEKQKDASKTEIKDSDDQKSSSKLLDEIFKSTTPRSERHEDHKTQDTEETDNRSRSEQNQGHSTKLMDEIFKTSAKLHKDVTQDMYVLGKDEEEKKHSIEKRKDAAETKPPRPKEKVHTNLTPRLDSTHTKEDSMSPSFGERGIKQHKEDTETKSNDKHSKHVGGCCGS